MIEPFFKLPLEKRYFLAAQYALWLADPELDSGQLRWVIACVALPGLLTPHLSGMLRKEWERLAGKAAVPMAETERRSSSGHSWKRAFVRLIATGLLLERDDGSWQRGPHFDSSHLRLDHPIAAMTLFVFHISRRHGGLQS